MRNFFLNYHVAHKWTKKKKISETFCKQLKLFSQKKTKIIYEQLVNNWYYIFIQKIILSQRACLSPWKWRSMLSYARFACKPYTRAVTAVLCWLGPLVWYSWHMVPMQIVCRGSNSKNEKALCEILKKLAQDFYPWLWKQVSIHQIKICA